MVGIIDISREVYLPSKVDGGEICFRMVAMRGCLRSQPGNYLNQTVTVDNRKHQNHERGEEWKLSACGQGG